MTPHIMPRPKRRGVRAWLIRLADRHHTYLNAIAKHYDLPTKAAALRKAVENELQRGPLTEQLPRAGQLAGQWCVERDAEDRHNIKQVLKLRHLRHESDAVRLAIEREYASIKGR